MPLNDPETAVLAAKIERQYPIIPMPPNRELTVHQRDCPQCEFVRRDAEEYRSNKPVDGNAIRYFHGELSLLSGKAWRWLFPHYLRYCLTDEAAYNQFETEFLIYNLAPDAKYKNETSEKLVALSVEQIEILKEFLLWLLKSKHWSEYCPEDIQRGIIFLDETLGTRAAPRLENRRARRNRSRTP